MEVLNYTDFRKNLKSVLDRTVDNHETVIIARSNDRDVVLLSLQEYNSWMETMRLLSTERNRARLLASVQQIEKGNFEQQALIEE
ncbi:MAG: type II toxin-antitoxin system Phd/YefM family antitoxin [Chitinophagia bacterium]|nr:type II toxin-antitoxin system Phd/YefM family antitoxin [Chitinophagia bacterium]